MKAGTWRVGQIALLSAALGVFLFSSTASARYITGEITALGKEGAQLKGADRIGHVEKYVAFTQDPEATAKDRLFAIEQGIRYLYDANRRAPLEGAFPKAHDLFSLYRREFVGTEPAAERSLIRTYVQTVLYSVVFADKASLDTYLALIDEVAGTLNADPADQLADCLRGTLCFAAADWERAVTFLEKYLALSSNADSKGFTYLTQCYIRLKRSDEALVVLSKGMERFEGQPAVVAGMAGQITGILKVGGVSEDKVVEMLPYCVKNDLTTFNVLSALAERRLASGDAQAALAYAKLAFSMAGMDVTDKSAELVGRCLTSVHGNPDKATAFQAYLTYGAAGPDGKVGTDDDGKNLLADVEYPLPPEVVKHLEENLRALLPTGRDTYAVLCARAQLCLMLGRPKEALRAFKTAYDVASIEQLKRDGAMLLPRALKAVDGTVADAERCLLYQKYGPFGPDGLAGTADDLSDPLAAREIPPLPPEFQAALLDITANGILNVPWSQARGYAFVALGDYAKALSCMRDAAGFVADEKTLQTVHEGIASAIKAFDGNARRADMYLLFQMHGRNGPDGKPGTADDCEDPLPAVLEAIKNAGAAPIGR